jgi:hypothetical protein
MATLILNAQFLIDNLIFWAILHSVSQEAACGLAAG